MIVGLIIFIMSSLSAPVERLAELFPNISEVEVLNKIYQSGAYSYFDTLGVKKTIAYIFLGIEAVIEFMAFLKFLPFYLSRRFERLRNQPMFENEVIKAIKYKIDNNIELNRREIKFYNKKLKKFKGD
ncbi:hypothetical protein [Mesomycoplasma lagogenitalium]|uniref:Uncharacterized protein n=1 Tax=Mesomycoplasma lagogenitalium TaxID=171286 RepID=A0ABY8LTB0_9BACT|nr:hypothetical protein [Mesomycoplasma lagogenitalium]WGI36475.1 hypothetical protein QEG99_03350 [Mesomycoplasma lagogenitalium]